MLQNSHELELPMNPERFTKNELGQYMTPSSVAEFMASLFTKLSVEEGLCFLDAGAGKGALTCAFLRKYSDIISCIRNPTFDLYEVDSRLIHDLKTNIEKITTAYNNNIKILNEDFIALNSHSIDSSINRYSHIMLNPPYKKLHSLSHYINILQSHGISSANLYAAFLSLAINKLKYQGELVAIIPRSFCNGFYHKKFREFIFENCSIEHVHLFKSRTRTFKEDNVLQENVIVLLRKGTKQGDVKLSISTDGLFDDYYEDIFPFSEVVHPDDSNKFIRLPIAGTTKARLRIGVSLFDIGVEVSTGPVVDFRARDFINRFPEKGDVPLIYPGHLNGITEWPKYEFRKPNAIKFCPETVKLLFPTGFYVAIRRMSSKEEKRRIVAHLIDPKDFVGFSHLGFENHLNIIHFNKKSLPESLARGITGYLNSSYVNSLFHCFNGHTQVNATDLRSIKYPMRDALIDLGNWIKKRSAVSQSDIDRRIKDTLPIK